MRPKSDSDAFEKQNTVVASKKSHLNRESMYIQGNKKEIRDE